MTPTASRIVAEVRGDAEFISCTKVENSSEYESRIWTKKLVNNAVSALQSFVAPPSTLALNVSQSSIVKTT